MISSSSKPTSPKTSPSTSPRGIRRPSMSKPISWLSRHSPNNSTSNNHWRADNISSPIHISEISEPKLVQDFYGSPGAKTFSPVRYGTLGSGATIVRTPQDALSRISHYPPAEVPDTVKDDDTSSYDEDDPPSPPLPPIPFASKSSPHLPMLSEMGELVDRSNTPSPAHNRSTRAIPVTPVTPPNARPVLKSNPTSPASLPAVPVLPLNISPAPPQPAFSPILLSSPPNTLPDLSTLMIGLDTSSSSLRTTYATLTSRPSYLAEYLESLAYAVHEQGNHQYHETLVDDHISTEDNEDDGHQLAPPATPFASVFSAHLASIGLLPQSASLINIFLDRPSAPYPHILAYLRQPTTSPATLPRAAALGPRHTHTPERIEALLELRDEAKYLGLEELYKLCCDELRQRTNGHVRCGSTQEDSRGRTPNVTPRLKEPLPPVSTMTAAALRTSNASSMEAVALARSQTPASRRSESRAQSQTRSSEGWI